MRHVVRHVMTAAACLRALQVAHAIGTDTRIGRKFLEPSCGFGGAALEKHLLNLDYICESLGLKQVALYWQKVRGGPPGRRPA